MFQAVRRAVNVLNVSTCIYISVQCDIPQCNYKRATRKRNRLNDLAYKSAAAYVEQDFARPMLASCIYIYIYREDFAQQYLKCGARLYTKDILSHRLKYPGVGDTGCNPTWPTSN